MNLNETFSSQSESLTPLFITETANTTSQILINIQRLTYIINQINCSVMDIVSLVLLLS